MDNALRNSEPLSLFALEQCVDVQPCSHHRLAQAQLHLDQLTKPIGSLGRLESMAAQLFCIYDGALPAALQMSAWVFAADHGVTEEGVSAYPRDVTAQMVHNFLAGGAAIHVLCHLHRVPLTVVDVGVDGAFAPDPRLVRAKLRAGSRNFAREPAMSHDELRVAVELGARLAREASRRGDHVVAVGEMGIGNTTSAAALTAGLLRRPVADVVGRGTGLDDAGLARKRSVVERALQLHFANAAVTPTDLLRCVGGLEIAAVVGFILSAAECRMAVVIDGFIATAAAALAVASVPTTRDFLFAGHRSEEPGHTHLLEYLRLEPILGLQMRLGEATGAVLALPILSSAAHLFTSMATFASAGVSSAL